jgi:hypothetical protein
MDISSIYYTDIYHSVNPILTCILHSINNYLGYSKYTENTIPVPTTLDLFIQILKENSYNTIILIIPSQHFHIFSQYKWLTILKIQYIFPIKDRHIYTIKRLNDIWIKLDSHPSEKRIISDKELLFEISSGYCNIILIESSKKRELYTLLNQWNPPNKYYNEFKKKLLNAI